MKVSAFTLVGDEHEALATLLRQWLQEGFYVDTIEVQLANRLLDELETRCLVLTERRPGYDLSSTPAPARRSE